MIDEVLDLGNSPRLESLRPRAAPGFPICALDPTAEEPITVAGRRVVAVGDSSQGVTSVSVDGHVLPVRSPLSADGGPIPRAEIVEVGVDRVFRRWSLDSDAHEELWMVPIALPFAVCRWRQGPRYGGRIVWRAPAGGANRRLRNVASSWAALDRSWHRDVGESANLRGPADLADAWPWARARILAGHPPGEASSAHEAAWLALGLCCLGRGELASAVVSSISDLDLRVHTEGWVNRWTARTGTHPNEGAVAFPTSLHVPGRTDTALIRLSDGVGRDPVQAAAFCGRVVMEGLGIRPDSNFGRVRFGPSETQISPGADAPWILSGLSVAVGPRPIRLTFRWSRELCAEEAVLHTLEIVPESGGVPLQAIFEPELLLGDVDSVTLNGQPVDAEIQRPGPARVKVRLQTPLDGPRIVEIVGPKA